MASAACVNNFLDCPPPPPPSYAWLSSSGSTEPDPITHNHDPQPTADFEFRLEHPVTMLPAADELFSDGKLLPLHLSNLKPSSSSSVAPTTATSPDTSKSHRRHQISISDPYLFSPKAPRCSSRWKELLGLKSSSNTASPPNKTTSSSSSSSTNKSLKNLLHRRSSSSTYNNKSATENAPLLSKEQQQQHSHSDSSSSSSETVSISSSRFSLSSSSSSHDHDNDLPRLSLDSDKPNPNPISIHRNPNHPRIRLVKPRPAESPPTQPPAYTAPNNRVGRSPIRKQVAESGAGGCRGVSVDSPRMNSSGKIVFQSLERSSSSPSSFNNGGPHHHNRVKLLHRDNNIRGMERSYSANVRVTPVLNVPVCSSLKSGSVFGFGQLFSSSSQQKKEAGGAANNGNGNNGGSGSSSSGNKGNQYRNRCDRS